MAPTASRSTSIVALMAVFGLAICFIIVGAISVDYQAALGIPNIGDLTLRAVPDERDRPAGHRPAARQVRLQADGHRRVPRRRRQHGPARDGVERPDGARRVRPARHRRDEPQHRRQHAHPGGAVRGQGPGAREQLRQRVLRPRAGRHAAAVLAGGLADGASSCWPACSSLGLLAALATTFPQVVHRLPVLDGVQGARQARGAGRRRRAVLLHLARGRA